MAFNDTPQHVRDVLKRLVTGELSEASLTFHMDTESDATIRHVEVESQED